jgi:hypothetical protein
MKTTTKTKYLALNLALCAMAVLLAGCRTVQPVKTFVRCGPNYKDAMPAVDRVGVLVDAVVAYDRVTSTYVTIEDSQLAITQLARETEADLKAKGYQVAFVEAPFIGAFKSPDTTFLVAPNRRGEPVSQAGPFQIIEDPNQDSGCRDALLALSRQIIACAEDRGEMPTDRLRSAEGARAALDEVAAKKNIRYLIVVQGNGHLVSGGKQAGQQVGTALVSSLLTMGMVTVVAQNVSWLDSYVSLIDLQDEEVLWSNSLRLTKFNAANPKHYETSRWSHNVLYWLPPRGLLDPSAKSARKK